MGIARQERVIDGQTFSVTQLPAMRALKMLSRLVRTLGPAAARLMDGAASAGGALGSGLGGLAQMNVAALGQAVTVLTERLTEAELESITRELLETATVDGRLLMPSFDLTMQGRMGPVLQLLAFALEVNYGSFFGVLAASATAEAARASSSGASNTLRMAGPAGA